MNGVFNHKRHSSFECVLSLLGVATTCLLKIDGSVIWKLEVTATMAMATKIV